MLTLVLTLLIQGQAPAPGPFDMLDLKRDVFVSQDTAYGLLPSEPIAALELDSQGGQPMLWSDDGKLLVLKVVLKAGTNDSMGEGVIPVGQALMLWNSATGRLRELFRTDSAKSAITDICWIRGTHELLANLATTVGEPGKDEEYQQSIVRILPHGEATSLLVSRSKVTAERAQGEPPAEELFIENSPISSDAFMGSFKYENKAALFSYWVVKKDGRVLAVKTPQPDLMLLFDAAGNPVLESRRRRTPGDPANPFYSIDTETGLTEVSKTVAAMPRSMLPVTVGVTPVFTNQTVTHLRARANLKLLWFKALKSSSQPAAFVGVCDGSWAISPKMDWVAYSDHGIVFARRIAQLSAADYASALEHWTKRDAMDRAHQIATGLQLYATDYDDNLPPGKGNLVDLLRPYLQNDNLFDGFSYIFPGGNLTGIEKPAETILGVMSTPYGNVNVYADGHVRWAK